MTNETIPTPEPPEPSEEMWRVFDRLVAVSLPADAEPTVTAVHEALVGMPGVDVALEALGCGGDRVAAAFRWAGLSIAVDGLRARWADVNDPAPSLTAALDEYAVAWAPLLGGDAR